MAKRIIIGRVPHLGDSGKATTGYSSLPCFTSFRTEAPSPNIFLILKNRYGGGKAISLSTNINLEVRNPKKKITLSRKIEIDYIVEGDCIAFYLYRFEKPSNENCSLKLLDCT